MKTVAKSFLKFVLFLVVANTLIAFAMSTRGVDYVDHLGLIQVLDFIAGASWFAMNWKLIGESK